MSTKTKFLKLEEYKEDIRDLFLKFTFGDLNYIDLSVMEQVFISLERPIQPSVSRSLQDEIQRDELPGVPYNRFEEVYLTSFPYDSIRLLNEAISIFDPNNTGRVTFDDMKKVTNSLSIKFTDEELMDIIHVFDETNTEVTHESIKNSYI